MFKNFVRLCSLLAVVFLTEAAPALPEMMNKELYQGDIQLTKEQEKILENPDAFTGLTDASSRWPTNMLGFIQVPFRIRVGDGFSKCD
jgi:hypothetical protein